MSRIPMVAAALLLFASSPLARTWHILPDGSGDAPTIQAGIDSAAAGDTVLVHDGTYTGLGNKDLDFNGKSLVVRSQNGPEGTIIDCEGSGRGFYIHNSEDEATVIQGFTVRNGNATYGGGMWIRSGRPRALDCWLVNNTAEVGGGVCLGGWPEAIAYLRRCVVSGNTANRGGGTAFPWEYGKGDLDSCVLTGNLATGTGWA
ncbi:MAG: hypothetical protein ABIK65_08320, partial [Candidatus Eisenbacteria bacterium]